MTVLSSATSVELIGRGDVTIRPSNYVTTGGEGSVYRLNDTIVKLYTDSQKMARDGMGEKLKLLSRIKHPLIVSPSGSVRSCGKDIGYYMPYIDAEPLSRMFTNDFIVRNAITHDATISVVKTMRDVVRIAHSNKAVMMDANELNWLVKLQKGKDPLPYVIDVDSWSIGRWKGSVIMPSIRDYHSKLFDEKSDWFAWGIVTFQLFTGIHPYKGTLDGYARGDLEARMKANASVFSKGIKLSSAVRDLTLIPKRLAGWYEAVFQKGERTAPPDTFDGVYAVGSTGQVYRTVITSTGRLTYTKLYDAGGETVITIFPSGIMALGNGDLVNLSTKKVIGTFSSPFVQLIEFENGYIVLDYKNGHPSCTYIDTKHSREDAVSIPFSLQKFVRYENRLFGVTEQGLTELAFNTFSKVVCSAKTVWGALPNSTIWWDGFGVQNTLGATFLITPYEVSACAYTRVPELDGVTITTGVRGQRNVSVIGVTKLGVLMRYDIVLAKDYKSYSCSVKHVDTAELSQVTLPKGVYVEIVDDGTLEVSAVGSGKVTSVEDSAIYADAQLYQKGGTVLYVRKGNVWSISMQ